MKKEAKQPDVLLWTKVSHKLTIFSPLSPQKLGLLLVLACCLLKARTSCIYKARDKISDVVGLLRPIGIDYQSFIKFFSTGKGDVIQKVIFQMVLLFLFSTCTECHLVLDRTNWEFGQVHKNILCIGAIYHGCFIPLVWIDLNNLKPYKLKVCMVLKS